MARPVDDQTGLKGNYDFRFEYARRFDDRRCAAVPHRASRKPLGLKLNARRKVPWSFW